MGEESCRHQLLMNVHLGSIRMKINVVQSWDKGALPQRCCRALLWNAGHNTLRPWLAGQGPALHMQSFWFPPRSFEGQSVASPDRIFQASIIA